MFFPAGLFRGKFLTVWALLNPCPDATNAMGTLPLTIAQRRPRMAAVRRRTVRCGLRLFISSRRPGGRFAAGPPRATVPAPLFGGHDGPGASWPD